MIRWQCVYVRDSSLYVLICSVANAFFFILRDFFFFLLAVHRRDALSFGEFRGFFFCSSRKLKQNGKQMKISFLFICMNFSEANRTKKKKNKNLTLNRHCERRHIWKKKKRTSSRRVECIFSSLHSSLVLSHIELICCCWTYIYMFYVSWWRPCRFRHFTQWKWE